LIVAARLAATKRGFAFAPPLDVFYRGYGSGDPSTWAGSVIAWPMTVEPYLGLTVQPVDFTLETERLVAFFHHGHSSSVLKVMLEQLRRSCL
jgi:hypothetical protein